MAALAAAAAVAAAGPFASKGVGIEAIRGWAADPVKYVKDVYGATPDPWQGDVLTAFGRGDQRIAMRACVGPGKSTILAWLISNFLTTRPEPKIIATSITGANLDDGLWPEINKWMSRSELMSSLFEWTASRIFLREAPENWFASARTWSRSATPEQQGEALAGKHADFILFVLDESGGIPDAVARTAENALASGIECRIVQAGNPTRLSGPLYRACTTSRKYWTVFEITGDPDDPKRAPRVSKDWAQQQIDENGRDSNTVRIRVLGQFPTSDANALLAPDDVLRAMRRDPRREVYADSPIILSCDVARGGNDRCTIWKRQGVIAFHPRIYRDLVPHGLMTLAGNLAEMVAEQHPDATMVDETGLGSGVVDRLKQLKVPVIGVNYASAARDAKKYRNKRTEIHFLGADWVKREGALPEVQELVAELSAPEYYTGEDGRLELESKDDIKKRLGLSPDLADGLYTGFSEPVVARAVRFAPELAHLRGLNGRARGADYNPLARRDR